MLMHKGTVELKTKKLILRRFTINDAENMYNNWSSDSDICKYMRWTHHKNLEETKTVISSWLNSYENISFYQWAVTLKENDEAIGAMGLFSVNESDLCGDVAYCISKKYWGQGIATEALKIILDFAFNQIGFNRIEAYHSINNPASGRVMQKAGMTFEGFARQKYRSIAGFQDCNMYAIIKEDFNHS